MANALRMKGGERALATADFVVGFSIASTWEIIRVGSKSLNFFKDPYRSASDSRLKVRVHDCMKIRCDMYMYMQWNMYMQL